MTEQRKQWTKDEPATNQTVVAQKMILTIPKNSRLVRKDIGMVFHNVTKTSVLRNFSSDGEKERPTIEIVVSNLNDPNKTETMRWTGNEEGSFDHLASGSKLSYRVTAVGTNGADVKIELIIDYLANEENK